MANVKIIHFTGAPDERYAARLLAFTKNTRLQMTPDGFDTWLAKPWEEIEAELDYMVTTIRSSWEFVDVVFSISDVSRACAQQITRTRNASYAMQSQRVTDVREAKYHVPDGVEFEHEIRGMMEDHLNDYALLIDSGVKSEDARGVLPMNIHCNLLAKYNLRALTELVIGRDSGRVQGEYRDIVLQMKETTIAAWPWSEKFFQPNHAIALQMIDEVADGIGGQAPDLRTKLWKAMDLIKK